MTEGRLGDRPCVDSDDEPSNRVEFGERAIAASSISEALRLADSPGWETTAGGQPAMTYHPGPYPDSFPPAPDPAAHRQQLLAEIAQRQASVAGAEAEIGRIVSGEIRAGHLAPATAEIDAEVRRVMQSEYAIGELQQQAYAIEAEAAAQAAAIAAQDPASRCPACRSGVTPHQRYCPVCGEKLIRASAVYPGSAGSSAAAGPLGASGSWESNGASVDGPLGASGPWGSNGPPVSGPLGANRPSAPADPLGSNGPAATAGPLTSTGPTGANGPPAYPHAGQYPPSPAAPPGCARCGRQIDSGVAYCVTCGWRVGRSRVPWYRARWLRFGLLGLVLYVFCQAMLPHTHTAGALIIAELIIGGALVPVVFVSYFYERGTRDQTPLSVLVTTFAAGAILGCTTAVILESAVKVSGNWGDLGVGFIEEGCKGVILFLWLRRADLRAPDRGLVIGAATGMGFAALETMQYGLQFFLSSLFNGNGSLAQAATAMAAELNVRGVLAPLGHGTWTGILAAVIWYERSAGRSVLGGRVLLAYVGVSLLHGLYDIAASSHVGLITIVSGGKVSIFVILFGLLGLLTLLAIARAANRGRDPVAAFFDSAGRLSRGGTQQHWTPQ